MPFNKMETNLSIIISTDLFGKGINTPSETLNRKLTMN